MTEPANPDVWEPKDSPPENLLLVSIERDRDKVVLKPLAGAERVLGAAVHESPDAAVLVDDTLPITEAYTQMEHAGLKVFCRTRDGSDAMSFFLLRGANAVVAFNAHLRAATR